MPPRKPRAPKRQTKLNFSPSAVKSSPATNTTRSAASSTYTSSASTKRSESNMPLHHKSRQTNVHIFASSSDSELDLQVHRPVRLAMSAHQNSMFDEDRKTRKRVDAHTSDLSGSELGGSSGSEHPGEERRKTAMAMMKRKRGRASSEEEDELGFGTVTVERVKKRKKPAVIMIDDDEEEGGEEEEEEEEAGSRDKRQKTRKKKRRLGRETASDKEIVQLSSRRHKFSRRASLGETESSENGHRDTDIEDERDPDNGLGQDVEEQEDLKEDLDFLRSSPPANRGRLRSTQDKPLNKRQQALEALKKKRAGTNEPSSSLATPARKRHVVLESESESESDLEIIPEEPIKSEPHSDASLHSVLSTDDDDEAPREANALDHFLEDADDAAFINDDDDDPTLGSPTDGLDDAVMLPLAISRLSSSKPKDLFRYAIEWMVMKKIHPAFDIANPVYSLTFRKLDDEISGLANSKFSSAAWRPDFSRAVRARPDITLNEITEGGGIGRWRNCEACGRSGHPATWQVILSGKPYDRNTLESLSREADADLESSDDDDDEDGHDTSSNTTKASTSSHPTRDAQSMPLPLSTDPFLLGATCKANAQVAHTLHHWRYHLYAWVVQHLQLQGHLAPEKLVKREKWSAGRRERAALKIVGKMERGGEVARLWRLYKGQVEAAVEAKHDGKRWRR